MSRAVAALAMLLLAAGCAAMEGGEVIGAGSMGCTLQWKKVKRGDGWSAVFDADTIEICRKGLEALIRKNEQIEIPAHPSRRPL